VLCLRVQRVLSAATLPCRRPQLVVCGLRFPRCRVWRWPPSRRWPTPSGYLFTGLHLGPVEFRWWHEDMPE
jgi:hypothetical protein